jgi:hypothetical protein
MPGCVQGADRDAPEQELPAVVEWLVLVVGLGEPVDMDRRPRRGSQPSVARDVGVVVGLEHVLDPHAHITRERQVLLDLELRIDDGGNAGVLVLVEACDATRELHRETTSILTRPVHAQTARVRSSGREHLRAVRCPSRSRR